MNKISIFNSITKLHCRSVLAQVASLASICAVSVQPVCTSRSDNLEVLEKCVHGKVLVYGKGSRLGESLGKSLGKPGEGVQTPRC